MFKTMFEESKCPLQASVLGDSQARQSSWVLHGHAASLDESAGVVKGTSSGQSKAAAGNEARDLR